MPAKTRAFLRKADFRERLVTAAIASTIGLLLLFSPIHRLGWITWMGVGLYAIALLTGVDEFVTYLSGHCPYCGKLIRAEKQQKQIACPHCQQIIDIGPQGSEPYFVTRSNISDKD